MTKLKSISKRTMSVLLCMVMLLTVFMSVPFIASAGVAYSFEEDGIRYLDLGDSIVSIVGINSETIPKDVVIPSTVQGKTVTAVEERAFSYTDIKSIVLPETVVAIGQYAFSASNSLRSVTILGNITTIESWTFQYCYALTEIYLPDSITHIGSSAFWGCAFDSIDLPKKLETIDGYAFKYCNLKQLIIPSAVHTIGNEAFSCIYNLTDVMFEDRTTIVSLGESVFSSCSKLTSFDFTYCSDFGRNAFYGCTSLTSVTLPDNIDITSGNGAFSYCSNLKTVNLSDSIDTIPNHCFDSCTSLENIQTGKIKSIGDSAFGSCPSITSFDFSNCTYIGWQAFFGCTGLTSVTLPDNMDITIKGATFQDCTNLKTAKLPNNMETIPDFCFSNCTSLESVQTGTIKSVGIKAFRNCRNIASFDLTYCTSIGSDAFCGCKGFTSVTLSDNIVSLGSGAFSSCTNLKTAKLTDNITTIPDSCFSNCTSLESIQTGKIKKVGYKAFYNCENLTDISFANDNNISEVFENAFENCTNLTEFALHDVQYIYDSAFKNCSSLIKVDLEGNKKLKSIEQRAFYGCTSLESIDIPATCENIHEQAFMNCESLYYVDIKSGLKKIGNKAFFNCYSLYNIIVPKSVESIGGMALGCYEKDGNYYSFSDFVVAGVKGSLADEYADAYHVYWALNAPKLSKVENKSNGVKVTFAKASGASSGKYEVYRCTDSSEWKMIGSTTSLSYTDKTAKSGTKYYYTVQFVGKPTNSLNDYPLEIVRLSTPKVSKITNTNSGAQLTWSKITGAAKYNVYVKSGSKWKKLGDTTSTSFIHTAAKSGTTYKYTVKAYDSSGDYASAYDSSGFSNKFVASPKISKTSNTTTGIKITWGKVTGAEKYRVFVKSGSKWKKLTDTTSTSYTHTGRESGKTYTYTVRCVSSTGKSYKSGYDKEGTKHLYLATPKVKKISNTIDGAKLTWGKVEGATKYNVYVKSGSKWKKLGDTTSTTFTHTTAKSGTTYTYTVKAYDETGAFASAYKSAGDKNKFIAAPVISELTSTSKGVKIKWGEVKGAVNYRVFVKTDASADWTKLTDTTSTSFTHKKAKSGKTYYYTVRCISSTGKSYVSGYDKAGQSILFEK